MPRSGEGLGEVQEKGLALHPASLDQAPDTLGQGGTGQAVVWRQSLPLLGRVSRQGLEEQARGDNGLGQGWQRRWRTAVWILLYILEFRDCGTGPELHSMNIKASSNQGTLETKC